jgi:hypothetical protein
MADNRHAQIAKTHPNDYSLEHLKCDKSDCDNNIGSAALYSLFFILMIITDKL